MNKKAWLIGGVLGLVILTGAALNSPDTQTQPASAVQSTGAHTITTQPSSQPTSVTTGTNVGTTQTAQPQTQTQPSTETHLSNDNYYTNSAGNTVHSPAYSNNGIPAGASARCGDGTYSFSQSRRGTCSHHGGVATWL